MDKRISYKIVIDTETCPCDTTLTSVMGSNMLVYDIGWAVVDKRGKVYKTHSYVNYDVYVYEKTLMASAYYAEKLPQYEADIDNGTRLLRNMNFIRRELLKDIAEYEVEEIYAHNMRFDCGALNNTLRYVTKSKKRYFFPSDVDICDTLSMSRGALSPVKKYRQFLMDNNLMTKHKTPRLSFSAENIYRYLIDDPDFKESHTALEDVMIEKEILAYCYRSHRKMDKRAFKA